jgi:hypothetical protein
MFHFQLYNRYVKNYGLCESALAIIHVSRHNDPILIKKLWENIIADGKYLRHIN